jgi:hypothetical protein
VHRLSASHQVPPVKAGANIADEFLVDEEHGGEGPEFDSAYSKLAYATIPPVDPCAEVDVADVPAFFATRLAAFLRSPAGASVAGSIPAFINDPERTNALQTLLHQHGN